MRQAGPHFLSVDYEGVAVEHRARLQARQVGAGARFGVTLAPDFLAGEHLEQVALFLLIGAEMHDSRADSIYRELVGAVERQPEPQHFVLVDSLIDHARAATAPFLGPVQRDVTGLVEPAMVVEQLRPSPVVAHVEQARSRAAETLALAPEGFGGVLLEPSSNFSAQFF